MKSRRPIRLIELENRIAPANVLTYHNDAQSTGLNNQETVLTRTNVNWHTFGKVFQVSVTGQVYAEPLVMQGVNITTGAHQGIHDVVFVATQHDQLYAIDATDPTGVILWQRSFLTTGLPGASSITPVPQVDVISPDITVEIGITGAPVIDSSTYTMYVVAKTKETVSGTAHYVQRIYAVNMHDGTNQVAPLLISNAVDLGNGNFNITSPLYVYGNGDGSETDPYNGTGQQVVQFNALRENQRAALTLVNGVVYVAWGSHGDNGPYHGWMAGFSKIDLHVTGVICSTPNGGLGGIWMAGGELAFDGTYFYCETGNGSFTGGNGASTAVNPPSPAPGPVTGLDAQGFPVDGNYGDSFLKVALDPTTTALSQNKNGWGLKVVDYFTPFNQEYLSIRDLDVGSSGPVVLPASVGSATHQNLLIGSGKEGVIYLIDRNNMGKFGTFNNIVQNTADQLSGSLDTAAYYNGRIYYVEGYGGTAKTFRIANGVMDFTPETRSGESFAFAGSTPSVSSNLLADAIVWDVDRGTNQLRAYNSDSYMVELYDTAQAPANRDALGAAVKFQVPTVVNGHVYVGSGTGDPNNALVVYGLITPPSQPPAAPSNLTATPVSSTQINLNWTDNDTTPNLADSYLIEQSPNGSTGWTQVASASFGVTSYSIGSLSAGTTYYFRLRAHNIVGNSAYSAPANAATSSSVHSINYPSGFTGASSSFAFNGGAAITSGRLRLTSGGNSQDNSVFFSTLQNITFFSTTFQYTKTGSADGATFVIQRDLRGLTALGEGGGSLGYGYEYTSSNRITPSFALAFSFYAGHSIGYEVLTNGNIDYNYQQSNIDVNADNTPITVTLSYLNGALFGTLMQGLFSDTITVNVNLPTLLGGSTAYAGFTGGTGGLTSTQDVVNWTFDQATPPSMPTNVQAAVTGYTAGSIAAVPLGAHLTWASAPGAGSYKIERRLSGGNWSQIGTATATNFDDTGLATQTSYDYRVRATNALGDSAYSSSTTIVTPALAPTPTNGHLVSATTNTLALQWTDNANNEDGFQVFRSVNSGSFFFVTSLPAATGTAPVTVNWTDTGLTAGTHYDYHIQAFNLSGYSDFTGVTTATKALAPTNLAAMFALAQVGLSWTASAGADSYRIYRATAIAGPYALIASGITANNYSDTMPLAGTQYYQVTAMTLGGESAASTPASVNVPPGPTVSGFMVNDGSISRSRVTSVQITFSTLVNFAGAPAAAFQMNGPYGLVTLTADTSSSTATQTIVKLTFSGTSVEYSSLRDGLYVLTALSSQVSAGGASLDGDANGIPGGNYTANLHRLFGDADGNRTVNAADFLAFRSAFGGTVFAFDFDGNGIVDAGDFLAFRSRFGSSV